MMKQMILAAALCGSLAPALAAKDVAGIQVSVLGRDWLVAPVEGSPQRYSATRLNLEHLPFRPPAVPGVTQAVRAIGAATGCSVNLDSMLRHITGTYYAQVICRK